MAVYVRKEQEIENMTDLLKDLEGSEEFKVDHPQETVTEFADRCRECGARYGRLLNQKWIPVSERLPENDEDVLVCYPQGGMEVVYYHIDNSIYPTEHKDLNETGWCDEEGDALYFEPIAWMPLPEPYKAEGSGE